MKKVQRAIYLTEEEWEQFDSLKEEYHLANNSRVMEYLLTNHRVKFSNMQLINWISESVNQHLDTILENIQQDIRPILLSHRKIEKQSEFVLNMFNFLLQVQEWDVPTLESNPMSCDDRASKLYQILDKRYDEKMRRLKEKKEYEVS